MADEQLRDLKKQIDSIVDDYVKELMSLRLTHEEILKRFQELLAKKQEDIIKKNLRI